MSRNPIYLTLDRRNNRIRITNEMLAYIGMPKYLQFLINPKDKMMLVRAMEKGTAKEQAYEVKYQPSNESYVLLPITKEAKYIEYSAVLLLSNSACILT